MYCATEFITTRSIDFSSIFRKSSSERTRILVLGAKRAISRPRTPGAGSARIQLAAGLRHLGRRQRFAAGIIQHHRVGRGDVADDIPRDELEMQVAMQLARIDRMRGIVIIDPVVHGRKGSGKTRFRDGNRGKMMR